MSRLDSVRARLLPIYKQRLLAGLPALAELLRRVELTDSDAASEARQIAHDLRGSGGSFGLPEITRAAIAVDEAEPAELLNALRALYATIARAARP